MRTLSGHQFPWPARRRQDPQPCLFRCRCHRAVGAHLVGHKGQGLRGCDRSPDRCRSACVGEQNRRLIPGQCRIHCVPRLHWRRVVRHRGAPAVKCSQVLLQQYLGRECGLRADQHGHRVHVNSHCSAADHSLIAVVDHPQEARGIRRHQRRAHQRRQRVRGARLRGALRRRALLWPQQGQSHLGIRCRNGGLWRCRRRNGQSRLCGWRSLGDARCRDQEWPPSCLRNRHRKRKARPALLGAQPARSPGRRARHRCLLHTDAGALAGVFAQRGRDTHLSGRQWRERQSATSLLRGVCARPGWPPRGALLGVQRLWPARHGLHECRHHHDTESAVSDLQRTVRRGLGEAGLLRRAPHMCAVHERTHGVLWRRCRHGCACAAAWALRHRFLVHGIHTGLIRRADPHGIQPGRAAAPHQGDCVQRHPGGDLYLERHAVQLCRL
eukprot:comp22169_c0_seq1/m.52075 comp22169_c0_seq1/g.52075  ORF comp22169_c0_seq1/g.52075 comp22169_c0_seq1/m.52075 type:complete len:440 (-) comp22169_c0_seq1:710-2029(-)